MVVQMDGQQIEHHAGRSSSCRTWQAAPDAQMLKAAGKKNLYVSCMKAYRSSSLVVV